jgi:glycolate oxidase iron-sulfur subunit
VAEKVKDVCQFLDELGMNCPAAFDSPKRVAYHDACHLAHAQKVRTAPRNLLNRIENLQLVEIRDGDICCGSAGSYNLEQPEMAARLGRQKADAVLATDADYLATGNIGCITQLAAHLKPSEHGDSISKRRPEVLHTIELLDRAIN